MYVVFFVPPILGKYIFGLSKDQTFRIWSTFMNPEQFLLLVTYLILYHFSLNWRLCLSSNSEARGGPIFLKFLHNNLALIYIQFCPLENFSGHQRFFRSGIKKKWVTFFNFLKMVNLNEIFYIMLINDCVIKLMVVSWPLSP